MDMVGVAGMGELACIVTLSGLMASLSFPMGYIR